MSNLTQQQSRSPLSIPGRQVRSSNRTLNIPTRDVSQLSRAINLPAREMSTQRFAPPMITKRSSHIDQSAFPFAMPLPQELPAAMTLLLPATVAPSGYRYLWSSIRMAGYRPMTIA